MVNPKPWLEKTKLCRRERNDYGICSFGKRCWFAHTEAEMRCYEFLRRGSCPRGISCPMHHPTTEEIAVFELMKLADSAQFKGSRPENVSVQYTQPLPRFVDLVAQCAMDALPPRVANSKEDTERKRMFQGDDLLKSFYAILPGRNKLTVREALDTDIETKLLFQRLLVVEWCQTLSDLRAYDLEHTSITPFSHSTLRDLWRIDCQGLAEKRPSVMRGDLISARQVRYKGQSSQWHFGYVHFVNLDHVAVHFHRSSGIDVARPYHVVFNMSDTNTRRQLLALDCAPLFTKQCFRERVLTTEAILQYTSRRSWDPAVQALFSAGMNPEQLLAVDRICCRGIVPPRGKLGLFLLHGPPGTGKTTTVVAAIASLAVNARGVLVVTPSNQSANLIVERLLKRFAKTQRKASMVRVVALSYDWRKECSDEVQDFVIPNEDFDITKVNSACIVVTTISSAGRLWAQSAAPFDHIIVDEAGQATEAELAPALAFAETCGAMVTLAGDHKQLGPILRSKSVAQFDFNRSTLERLMSQQRVLEQFSVQLTKSYRAHPDILHTYNTLTYRGTLEAQGDPTKTDRLLHVRRGIHSNMRHPLRFYHVQGQESRESDSPSWMNNAEARVVIELITDLLGQGFTFDDIVVLSPYAKQCKVISGILHQKFHQGEPPFLFRNYDKRYPPIKVCSVELFQGREAPIIILSCVRSRQPSLVGADQQMGIGFLKQPQRLNVAISRAIAGLFIVGNAGTLQLDSGWKDLIAMFHQNYNTVYDASLGRASGSRPVTGRELESLGRVFSGAAQESAPEGSLPPDSMRLDTEWSRQQ